ncbi:MAG: hypothetical protein ACXW3X_04345, partial [Rhodoplanes sp.]
MSTSVRKSWSSWMICSSVSLILPRARAFRDELAPFALQPRLVTLELREARNGHEVLSVEIRHADELLRDQLKLASLCFQLGRKPADLLVDLGDALAQLRALARARTPSRLEQFLVAGHGRGRDASSRAAFN